MSTAETLATFSLARRFGLRVVLVEELPVTVLMVEPPEGHEGFRLALVRASLAPECFQEVCDVLLDEALRISDPLGSQWSQS